MKTDSPALYQFTKLVLEHYQCRIHTDLDSVYAQSEVSADLKIKTHYESLDIAGSNRINYLCFSLSPDLASPEKELSFKEKLAQYETTKEN